jgi:hypothetical protein
MLEAFVSGQLSADDFQTRYFEMYEDDPRAMSKEVFRIVDSFFADVDSYVDNPALRDPSAGDLGPDELKERARDLLRLAGFEETG